METIINFLEESFSLAGIKLTAANLLFSILVLVATILVHRFLSRKIKALGSQRGKGRIKKKRRSLRIAKVLVWLLGISLSITFLEVDLRSLLEAEVLTIGGGAITGLNILFAIVIVILARLGLWYFRKVFIREAGTDESKMDKGRRLAIFQIFRYLIFAVAIIIILSNLNLNLNVLVASSAALLVGVGLALQRTFEDVASGIIILFEGTIEVGDMVFIDSLKLEGKVIEIRLRSSVLETLDSMTVIVPNSRFTSTNVINWSFNDRETRFHVIVSVAYGSDVALVRKVMKESALAHGRVLKSPEPRVRFEDFGDSGLLFDLLFWTIRWQEYQDIKSDLRYKIEAEFKRHNITVPFPQRDLHIRSDFRIPDTRSDAGASAAPGEGQDRENPR